VIKLLQNGASNKATTRMGKRSIDLAKKLEIKLALDGTQVL
jgi:hypothetical protein